MCDFSLMHVASRPASVGDKLVVLNFGTGTTGLASVDDKSTAVCLLPGTEVSFDDAIKVRVAEEPTDSKVAIFRQINKDCPYAHHDCLELPDGKQLLLTYLEEGQNCTVLQLPAAPKTAEEAKDQERLATVG